MLASDSITNIIPALIKAKAAFKPAVKDSTNPAFKSKYVSLDAVLEAVEEALLVNGIALTQPTRIDEVGTTILTTLLLHSSGEFFGSEYPVKPVKQDPQGEGSALTYARRYALMSLVGIAPEDDDGNAASQRPKQQDKPKAEPPFDENAHNEWMAAIDAADSVDTLNRLGQKISAAPMPTDARNALRAAFGDRMKAVRA